MRRITQKTLAIVAAAAFATATPLALVPSAFAQVPTTTTPAPAGVDLNADATLTIEKRLGEVGSTTPAPGGFKFKVEMIQLDSPLNTALGWTEAQNIIKGTKEARVVEEEIMTIGSDGKATASMPVGLYRVTELQNGNYTVAAPFYVTLPLMNSDGTVNYNPTISPKNQLLTPTKAAADTNVGVGDNITYTIMAPVPVGDVLREKDVDGNNIRSIAQFRIVDPLIAELQYVADSATVTLEGVTSGDATLASTDYNVTLADADGDPLTTADNNSLIVEFTEAGRAKLANLRATNPGLTAQVVFKATVLRLPASGEITNQASIYIRNSDTPIVSTPEDPTQQDPANPGDTSTSTQYVNVEITKTLDGANSVEAAGAQFNVVACTEKENETGKYTIDADSTPLVGTNPEGTAKTTGPITAVATTDSAIASGYGMQFTREQQYCAVETKAPAGYLINPEPTPLNLTTQGTGTPRPVYTATVNNVKDNIFGRLPATGETTMLALLALGLVLFAGGAAYQLRQKNA